MDRKQLAKEILERLECTCVSIRGISVYTSDEKGIKPIISKMVENQEFFKDSVVADMVIGKAAAMLLIYSGVQYIYGKTISESALQVLEKYQIPVQFETIVPYILNRNKDAMCPMEQCVLEISEPEEAFLSLRKKLNI